MNSILEVFIKISENEDIKITQLEEKIGASKGVLSRAIKNNSDIQAKWLLKLVENYPQYNAEWLLTGQGPMLKEPTSLQQVQEAQSSNNDKYTALLEKNIAIMEAQFKDKEEKEALLKDKIADLEEKLKFAEFRDKKDMDFKIKAQRKKIRDIISEKDEIIFAQNNTINEQNEEINAMKSRHSASNDAQQIQPSKGI